MKINKERINICIVFNDSEGDYIVKCLPTIFSILENNKNEFLDFYIIYKGAKKVYLDYLRKIFKDYNQKLYLINDFTNKEYLVDFFKKNNTSSWNYGTFFKLLIPLLLPKDLDKVINFDSDDIVVTGSLQEMWNLELADNLIGSVEMPNGNEKNQKKNILGVEKPFRMGGNIYNLKSIRKIEFEEKIKSIIIEKKHKLKNAELDVLNIICNNRVLYIDEKFNFCPPNYNIFNNNKLIYHFAGRKIHLFKFLFGVHNKYYILYNKYFILSKYKFIKRFDLIRSLYSIKLFNFIIKKIIYLLDLLGIKNFIKNLLRYK